MHSLIRPRLLAGAAFLLLLAVGASQHLGSAKADEPTGRGPSNLVLGSQDSAQPQNMEEFLTAVTKDVDAYWTKVFKDSGLPEPRVSYAWIPDGQTAASACGDETAPSATAPPRTARATTRSTSRRSSRPTSTTARSTRRCPAARRATAGPSATSRSPTSSRTSTAIRSRTSSACSRSTASSSRRWRSSSRPTATPAPGPTAPTRRTASRTATCRRRSTPRSPSATSTRATPGHHGTPEQREEAWKTGFESGDPSSCSEYLSSGFIAAAARAPKSPCAGSPS